MNCTLNNQQQEQLFAKVFKDLSDQAAQNIPFDFKEYATDLHAQIVSKTGDNGLGISYISLLPQNISLAFGLRPAIRKMLAPVISDIVSHEDDFQSFDIVAKFISPDINEIESLQRLNEEVRKEELDPTMQLPVVTPVVETVAEAAVPPTPIMSDWTFESDDKGIKPEEQFYSEVKRRIIDSILNNPTQAPTYPDAGEISIAAISDIKIDPKYLRPGTEEFVGKGGVVLAITNKGGDLLYFNDNYEISDSEKGKPAYYNLYKTDPTYAERQVKVVAAVRNISEEAAKPLVQRELETIGKIREYINQDRNNKVTFDIIGGNLGTVVTKGNIASPLSALRLNEQPFSPSLHMEPSSRGKKKGFMYLDIKGIDKPIQIEKPTFSSELAQNIASLLFDDLVDEKGLPIPANRRISIASQFIYTGNDRISLFPSPNNKFVALKVPTGGVPSDVAGQKEFLVNYLTKLAPTREIKESQVGNRRVLDGSNPEVSKEYKENYIVKQNDRFFIIEPMKLQIDGESMGSKTYNDFSIKNGVLTTEKKSYPEFIKNNFVLFNPLDAQGRIQTLGAYLVFKPKKGELNKVYSTKPVKEVTEKAKVEAKNALENLTKVGEGKKLSTAEQTKIFLANKLKNRPNRPLHKLMRQKAVNVKATEEQIKEAKKWYDNHPLSKYAPYETMFTMINMENSQSVAHWTTSGITLFKGSDYSDLYHEAWHGFSQTFLTQKEKGSLYKELQKKTGSFVDYAGNTVTFKKATQLQLEEHLAEDFRKYALSGGKHVFDGAPTKNSLFRRIWNFLKSLFTDSSLVELNADLMANEKVKELYDKLWIGDINELSFSEANRNYNVLNKGLERIGDDREELPSLSYEDTNTIMESVDSIFSEYADFYNSGLNSDQMQEKAALELKSEKTPEEENRLAELRGAQTYQYSSLLFKTQEGLQSMYEYAQLRFAQAQEELMKAEAESNNPVEKSELARRLGTINYALRNFGDVENLGNNRKGKGVIGYHLFKSELISSEVLSNTIEDEVEEGVETQGKQYFDRGGNEYSLAELADEEIERVLRGLTDTNGRGEVQYNVLGFPKLAPYKVTLHRIMMAVQNVSSPQKMYELLQQEQDNYPPIKQLLEKLGPVSYPGQSEVEVDNWNAFFQTFDKYKISLRQTTVNIVSEDEAGNAITPRVEFTIGEAFGDYKNIATEWQNQFSQAIPGDNNYIINRGGRNQLAVERITTKYPDADSIVGKEFEFLRDIGINLRDDNQMRKALKNAIDKKEIKLSTFPTRIQQLKKEGKPITFINQIVKNEGRNYNRILNLQLRLSGENSDGMSRNAEGDLQSEYSLNTSLTQMVKRINEAASFADLVSIPAMSHLSPYVKGILKNPFIINSVWMNSIFDMKNGGAKRPGAMLRIENLSGVTLLNNGKSTDTGTATATADPATKLIMDFHLQLMKGTPEMVRMADKKTSLTTFVSKIVGGNKQGHLYVDTAKFIDAGNGGVYGNTLAFDIIFPYLKSEMMRVAECRRLSEKNSGVKEYDFDYLKRGSSIVLFDGILSDDTKEKLYKIEGNVDDFFNTEAGNDLRATVSQEVSRYFADRAAQFKKKLQDTDFVAKELLQEIRTAGQKENFPDAMLTDPQLREAAVKSFVYNNWIHNAEQSFVLLGDVALYKDFNKRIPGFNSTGDVMRTDSAWYDHVNQVVGNPYRKSKGLPDVAYSGLINTAVVEDVTVVSHYIDEYKKVLGENAKKYEEINEGDAGAWITFDMYRIIRKSLNKWTPAQEKLFQKIVKGETVENIEDFFPVVKMSYSGPLVTEHLPLSAYHKFALFPLIPNVIKGTNLELLHDKMMKEDVGYVTFESGSKVSTITDGGKKDKLYSDVAKRKFDETPFTKNTIYAEFLKDQIEVSNKFKNQITFASQMRTLVDTGLLENGVPVDFMKGKSDRIEKWKSLSESEKLKTSQGYKMQKTLVDSIFKLGEVKKQQLLREMGWKLDKNGTPQGDVKTLVEFVNRELETKDLGEHERVFLQVGKDGQLKHDLSLSPSSDQIEKLIIALLNKRLIKYKVNGEQLTQVSGAGFEKPSEADIKKYGTNDLPTYHRGEGGLTRAAKCKIALQGDFKKLLSLPEVERESRKGGVSKLEILNGLIKDEKWLKDNRQLITMVGARIPTQGLNSMEFVEVWEFLPENAGNILIMPAEITTKSGTDYDYDKLPFMMPNLRAQGGKIGLATDYTEAEARAIYDRVKKNKLEISEMRTTTGELRWRKDPAVDKLVSDIFGKAWEKDYTEAEIDEILKDEGLGSFENFFGQLNGSRVVENEIIQNFKKILEQPENFENLIKPNDTNLVEPLAKELSKYVADVTYKKGSGSHLFDFLYNLQVHQVNSVGKKTLGIAAAANIYNSILNDVGAKMNPFYTVGMGKTKYRNEILLDHNKIGDVISLSNLYNKEGVYIPEIISQLMNGSVDVAKDPWIFYLQANEELAPTLLFMIKAGVPLKQAVYMLTQPLVREYVKKQQLYKSTFAPVLGLKVQKNREADAALMDILTEYGFGTSSKPKELYETTLKFTKEFPDAFKEENLLEAIKAKRISPTNEDRAVFLHFIEIEKMAKSLADLQTRTSVDRKTSIDLTEINEAVGKLGSISSLFPKLPSNTQTDIMRDTVVGAYNQHGFMLDVLGKFIKLKNHPVLNSFLKKGSTTFLGERTELNELYSEGKSLFDGKNDAEIKAKFESAFRSDLMSYIFQNEVRAFDMNSAEYKGNKSKAFLVEETEGFAFGAFLKDGTLFVDKKQLSDDFAQGIYSTDEYVKRGLAKVSSNAFLVEKDYYHFVYEREVLRSLLPFAEVQDKSHYKSLLQSNLKNNELHKEGDSEEIILKKMKRRSYEEFLRNKALENIYNPWAMFRSSNAFATQFTNIKKQYPELSTNYSVVRNLIFDSAIGYRNLKLTTSKLDKDSIELYNENLKDLADKSIMKVTDLEENNRISELFAKFPFFAFMQSGMNLKSQLSLGRIIPQEMFIRVMEKPQKEWMDKMSDEILTDYLNRFIIENSNRGIRIRSKDYLSNATLDNPVVKETNQKVIGQVEMFKEVLPNASIQMQDKNVKKILSGKKTTTTRSETQAKKINIPVGTSAIVLFDGEKYKVTNKGLLSIQEAGGKESILKSEGVSSENEFSYQQTKDWINGVGKLFVYDIKPLDENIADSIEPIKPEIKKISDEEVREFFRTCYL